MTKPLEVGEKVKVILDQDVSNFYLPLTGYYLGLTMSEYWICSDPDFNLEEFDGDPVFPDRKGGFFILNYGSDVYEQNPRGQQRVARFEQKLKGLVKFLRKVEEQYV